MLVLVTAWVVAGSGVCLARPALIWPVDATIAVPFEEPPHRWGPGHRGIDLAVERGTRIRAAAAGMVSFAGAVAGHLAVTISHPNGYETTYSALDEIAVAEGQEVTEGTWIGRTGRSHPGGEYGLHFGVRLNDGYVDPSQLLGTLDVSDAIRLAPIVWQPPREMPEAFRSAFADAGTADPLCRSVAALQGRPPVAPNDNVAIALAGISSSTDRGINADIYEHGPVELGYPSHLVYDFSYAGPDAEDLHRPYPATDTFGDISAAADLLRETLREVARRHPGKDVDLIAHSMGGLVARRYLTTFADEGSLPRIEHLVTFASPHQGSSIAALGDSLEDKTLSGGLILDGASAWSRHGGPLPDPRSVAVEQLTPGSTFLSELGAESVAYGTRVLALGIPNDLVVTADRAHWDEATSRTVAPSGLQGHSAIVRSTQAQGVAYSFLRDAAPTCEGGWDLWGPRIGRAVGFAEQQSYRGIVAIEEATLGRALRVGKTVDRFTEGRLGRVARKVAGKLVHRAALTVKSHLEP